MKRHPLSALFSRVDLKGVDLETLAEDIQDQGQLSPITLFEGMILDGWNRYQACLMAGVEPVTIELGLGQDPWEFVKGSNMFRRHMSPAERVAVMLLHAQMGQGSKLTPPSLNAIEADIEVSRGTAVKAASIAKANDPALIEALADKKVSLDRAALIAKMPEPERAAAIEAKPEPKAKPSHNTEALEARIAELEAENTELKDSRDELARMLSETISDNESMALVFESEDRVKEALAQVKQFKEQARLIEVRNHGMMGENKSLADLLKKSQAANKRMEKRLKQLEPAESVA